MAVRVCVQDPAQPVDLFLKMPHERADAVSQDIDDRVIHMILSDISDAGAERSDIVDDRLGRPQLQSPDPEASRVVVFKFSVFCVLAGDMIS